MRAYTFLRLGSQLDPSKILVDSYTPVQDRLQFKLDQALLDVKDASGEVLVLIPFRDRWEMTDRCLRLLHEQIRPPGVKIRTILINNRSQDRDIAILINEACRTYPAINIQALSADYDFNYSRINNDGFRQCATPETKWLLCLNNDVELLDKTIIQRMIQTIECLPEAGVVGCSLIYPNRRIQHLFAAPGVKIIAAHPLRGHPINPMMSWFTRPARVVPAVTGAVMLMRAVDFAKVGMFDEDLPSLGQDVIICLQFWKKLGKCSISVNSGDVIHHESLTKKPSFPRKEIDYIYKSYSEMLKDGELYSTDLSRWSERPSLALPLEPSYPARWVIYSWSNS